MPLVPIDDEKPQRRLVPVEEPQKGFFGRMGSDVERRLGNLGESYQATDFFGGMNPFSPAPEQGSQSELEFLAQAGGQGIGLAGDVLGNLAISGYRALAPESIQDAVGSGLESFAQSPVGQGIGSLAQQYGQFAEENPRAARNIGAIGNIASVMPFGKATKQAGTAMRSAANRAKGAIDDIVKRADEVSSDAFRKLANDAYKVADEAGAAIKPDAMQRYAKEIVSLPEFKTEVGEMAARKAGKITGYNQVKTAQEIIEGMAKRPQQTIGGAVRGVTPEGMPVSLRGFNEVDQTLSEMLYGKGSKLLTDQGTLNKAGQQVKNMQEALRDKVLNAPVGDIIGDKTAFETLQSARELWRKQIKLREVEDVLKAATFAQQPATAIKTGFKRLSKKTNLFNEAEMEVIMKAADTGSPADIFAMFGSRLPSTIATGSGDFATGALMRGMSVLPRNMATNAQVRNAQNLMNTIAGVPTMSRPAQMTQSGLRGIGNLGATGLNVSGRLMQTRAPQLTTLGVLNEQFIGEQ